MDKRQILKQFYGMELTSREFEYLEKNCKNFKAEKFSRFIDEKCAKYGVAKLSGYDLSKIMDGATGAMKVFN